MILIKIKTCLQIQNLDALGLCLINNITNIIAFKPLGNLLLCWN